MIFARRVYRLQHSSMSERLGIPMALFVGCRVKPLSSISEAVTSYNYLNRVFIELFSRSTFGKKSPNFFYISSLSRRFFNDSFLHRNFPTLPVTQLTTHARN